MRPYFKIAALVTILLIVAAAAYLGYLFRGGYLLQTQGFSDYAISKRHTAPLADYLRAIGARDRGLALTLPGDSGTRVWPRFLRLILTDQPQLVTLARGEPSDPPLVSYSVDYHALLGLYTIRLQYFTRPYDTPESLADVFSFNFLRALARQATDANLGDPATLLQINDLVSSYLSDQWARQGPITVRPRAGRLGGFRLIPQAFAQYNCGSTGIIECGTLGWRLGCQPDNQPGAIECASDSDPICDNWGGCVPLEMACFDGGGVISGPLCSDAPTCYGNPCTGTTVGNCLFYRNCAFPPGLPPPPPPTPIVAEVFLPRL